MQSNFWILGQLFQKLADNYIMGIEYSKLSNEINGIFGALDALVGFKKPDGELTEAELKVLDRAISEEPLPLSLYLEEQAEDISRFDSLPEQKQSVIARNLMEYVECLSQKSPDPLDMPQEPGETLVTSGNFYFRPNSPVAIDATSFSSDWAVKTSGVIGRSDGIEIPFGLVKVENRQADVRGTVRYAKFDIVLESDTPMRVEANGATRVTGKVTIKTPYGNFVAEAKGDFKIFVGENEAPTLIVGKSSIAIQPALPVRAEPVEAPFDKVNRFRINKGSVSLLDTNHYAFTARSEFDLGDRLTGNLANDYHK